MSIDPIFYRAREELVNQSGSMQVRVVSIDLTGEPMVSVVPIDGEGTLSIDNIPYQFASSSNFAMFIPPHIGMEGYLMSTNKEVGDNSPERFHDRASGVFVPSGMSPLTKGSTFAGNADWAEMRSGDSRVALSENMVHLEAGSSALVMEGSGADIISNGMSLIDALKQMSQHIAALEALVHPDGNTHGGTKTRMIDTFNAVTAPTRNERGVR